MNLIIISQLSGENNCRQEGIRIVADHGLLVKSIFNRRSAPIIRTGVGGLGDKFV